MFPLATKWLTERPTYRTELMIVRIVLLGLVAFSMYMVHSEVLLLRCIYGESRKLDNLEHCDTDTVVQVGALKFLAIVAACLLLLNAFIIMKLIYQPTTQLAKISMVIIFVIEVILITENSIYWLHNKITNSYLVVIIFFNIINILALYILFRFYNFLIFNGVEEEEEVEIDSTGNIIVKSASQSSGAAIEL